MVSQEPPKPTIDNPMGKTQQDADSKANKAATGTIELWAVSPIVKVCWVV